MSLSSVKVRFCFPRTLWLFLILCECMSSLPLILWSISVLCEYLPSGGWLQALSYTPLPHGPSWFLRLPNPDYVSPRIPFSSLSKGDAVVDGTKPTLEFPDWSFFSLIFSTARLPCRSMMSKSLCCKQQKLVGCCHHQWKWCPCWWYKTSSRISWSSGWLELLHLIFFKSLISVSFCCSLCQ